MKFIIKFTSAPPPLRLRNDKTEVTPRVCGCIGINTRRDKCYGDGHTTYAATQQNKEVKPCAYDLLVHEMENKQVKPCADD